MKRWKKFLPLSVFLLLIIFLANPRRTTTATPQKYVSLQTDQLAISSPGSFSAGQPLTIEITGAEAETPITLIVETGYAAHRFEETATASRYRFTIPAFQDPASGNITLTALQGQHAATAETVVTPGVAVDPIDVYLGPRTVTADTEHFVMQVAVPKDRWGNPVAADTAVGFTVTRADLATETYTQNTAQLLSWIEVFSGTVAGRTRIATEVADAGALERDFLEVAGEPVPYQLELVDPLLPADGQSLIRVQTEILEDVYENILPDGVAVHLDVQGITGPRRISGQTVDGKALFVLQAPHEPGSVTAEATAAGIRSEPLELDFASAVLSMEATVEEVRTAGEIDGSIVRIGPVRSVRKSFVPDGTKAVISTADGTETTVDIERGYATVRLSQTVDASTVTVEILGSSMKAEQL